MNFIYVPFSYLMKGCLFISGNSYLFALFFFALVIQIILLPLAIKQQKSQIMMAKIKPKEMAIREKYKGRTDRVTQQKMTMEIQQMYQDSGYNQFSGCLPLLIQLPIIFILFNIVRAPITYASNLDNFNVTEKSKEAVVFYQDVKEALVKDKFETVDEYNEYVTLIDNYQVSLGGELDKDNKTESGLNIYKGSDRDTGENEMGLSRLIIDGKTDLETLVNEGKIDGSIIEKYDALGFGDIGEDDLPDYRIGSLNLINEPDFGANIWLMIVPVLVFLTSFLSTKLTRKVSGAANQTDANGNPIGGGLFMEVGMPLISAIFAYSMPAAVGAYWIWRTLLGMVQAVVMAKVMPIPKVSEEDIAAARKEMKAKQKKKKVITIEVDEDDNSYDDLMVRGDSANRSKSVDVTQRTPRRIEMLTADDEESTNSDGEN